MNTTVERSRRYRERKRLGLSAPLVIFRPNQKLKLSDAIRIRRLVRLGRATQSELAREYSVTPGTIHYVVQRKTHKIGAIAAAVRRKNRKQKHRGQRVGQLGSAK